MFRPIRVDHTNCLQVAIKTHYDMKGLVDKSMGIVSRITEALARIKPTDPLRLDKRDARKKRNYSDSSGNCPTKILASRCTCKKSSRAKSF